MLDYAALETERVFLKILDVSHTEEVFAHFSDPNITEFMDIEPCKDVKEAEEIIIYHLEDAGCRWGLFDKTTNQLIGTAGYHYLRKTSEGIIAEIGFDLAKSHWGKGLMREVLQEVIRFGFTEMELYMIDATVEPANERSLQLMNRLGFQREEELRDNLVYFYLKKK